MVIKIHFELTYIFNVRILHSVRHHKPTINGLSCVRYNYFQRRINRQFNWCFIDSSLEWRSGEPRSAKYNSLIEFLHHMNAHTWSIYDDCAGRCDHWPVLATTCVMQFIPHIAFYYLFDWKFAVRPGKQWPYSSSILHGMATRAKLFMIRCTWRGYVRGVFHAVWNVCASRKTGTRNEYVSKTGSPATWTPRSQMFYEV